MKTVVLGLGNTLLSDDGVGVYAARALKGRLQGRVEVREAGLAGLDTIELLKGYDRAVIIDAVKLDGVRPGIVFRLKPEEAGITPRLASFHDIDLVTALALGRRLGFEMPEDVVIYAVQVEDALTIGEGCSPSVERAIPALVNEISGEIDGRRVSRISVGLDAGRRSDA